MTIGFAGSGNMAAALARGFARAGASGEPMLFADSGSGRAAALAEELGGEAVGELAALASRSDVLILAVKPKALDAAAAGIGPFSGALVSVLGATPLAQLREAFPEAAVLRTMPNVGVELGRGVICHTAIPDDELAVYLTQFQYLLDEWLDEYEQELFNGLTLRRLLQDRSDLSVASLSEYGRPEILPH